VERSESIESSLAANRKRLGESYLNVFIVMVSVQKWSGLV